MTRIETETHEVRGVQIIRQWRVEGNLRTALGARIGEYPLLTAELETLNPEDPDWWYLADIEDLAAILAPWAG